MNVEQPDYWLAYVGEDAMDGAGEITATAPTILDRTRLSRDARIVLAAADTYHGAHPTERVVFVAAVTRWLVRQHDTKWSDLAVDFARALAELDRHAPALLIDASPLTIDQPG